MITKADIHNLSIAEVGKVVELSDGNKVEVCRNYARICEGCKWENYDYCPNMIEDFMTCCIGRPDGESTIFRAV